MIRFALAFLVGFIVSGPAAHATLQNAVVKVSSTANDGSVALRGSGLAFSYLGQAYVLTSDHVVLHDNDSRTHTIQFDLSPATTAEYVTSDFGRGLALLRISGTFDKTRVAELPALAFSRPLVNERVVVMGFPAMSTGVVRDARGSVSNPTLSTKTLVQVREMVEIDGAHGEFGMSGGVVASMNDEFVGVLSHQIYVEGPDRITNKILVIPGALAVDWAKKVLDVGPAAAPIQLGQATSQLLWKDELNVGSHHLAFWWMDPLATGYEIFTIRHVRQSLSPEFIDGPTGSLAELQKSLEVSRCIAYLRAFRTRGAFGQSVAVAHDPISHLRQFENPATEPVLQLFCNETEDAIRALEDHERELQSLYRRMTSAPVLARYVLQVIQVIDGNQSSDPAKYHFHWLKRSDLEWLMTAPEFRGEWSALAKVSAEQPLRAELEKLKATYQHLSH